DLDGDPREARIRQAAALSEAALRRLYGDRIGWVEAVGWDRREGRVSARRRECRGALVLDDRAWREAPPELLARAALEGLRLTGLPWTAGAARLRARIALFRSAGYPDMSDAALLEGAEDWLLPWLSEVQTETQLKALDLTEPLKALL